MKVHFPPELPSAPALNSPLPAARAPCNTTRKLCQASDSCSISHSVTASVPTSQLAFPVLLPSPRAATFLPPRGGGGPSSPRAASATDDAPQRGRWPKETLRALWLPPRHGGRCPGKGSAGGGPWPSTALQRSHRTAPRGSQGPCSR